ncbi:basic proline-rich protein-like [Macrobrachium nipponense]|uniref:basic proline-rich protein-like n=1 Tax=Macrobrachium nipponense TaxID=159736 RepID=UPI0030C8CF7C
MSWDMANLVCPFRDPQRAPPDCPRTLGKPPPPILTWRTSPACPGNRCGPSPPGTRGGPHLFVPGTVEASPARPWTRGRPRPPVPGHMADLARPSLDTWQTSPARPWTRGRPHPPVPGHVADLAHPSREPCRA